LEGHEHQVGDAIGDGVRTNVLQADEVEVADEAAAAIGAEGERVPDGDPDDGDHARRNERLHDCAEDVLVAG
jgi:hypothetical protein